METCIRACIAKDSSSRRVQVNAGDRIKPFKKFKGIWKVVLFGKGVVTITDNQLMDNFGTPVMFKSSTIPMDNTSPIGEVEVYG